mgnify:CR=1 FL=1
MRKFRIVASRQHELELLRAIASLTVHVPPRGGIEEPILSELERIMSREEVEMEDLKKALTLLKTAAGGEDEYYRAASSVVEELVEVERLERYVRKLIEIGVSPEQVREGGIIFLSLIHI